MYIYIYVYIYMCVCVYIYIYIYTYIFSNTRCGKATTKFLQFQASNLIADIFFQPLSLPPLTSVCIFKFKRSENAFHMQQSKTKRD